MREKSIAGRVALVYTAPWEVYLISRGVWVTEQSA